MNDPYQFILPVGPSVNAMYRKSWKSPVLYKTKEAKDWIKICKQKIGTVKTLEGKVEVMIIFYFDRGRDIDSCLKSTLDLMQDAGVIVNDSQVFSLLVKKLVKCPDPRVEIFIGEING